MKAKFYTFSEIFSSILNAKNAKLQFVLIHGTTSHLSYLLLQFLYKEGFIQGFFVGVNAQGISIIFIKFRYTETGQNVLKSFVLISTRTKRVFVKIQSLWKKKSGLGLFLLSTNRGVLSDTQARLINTGGLLLCSIA